MQQYLDLLGTVLRTGTRIHNERTGKDCFMIPGAMLKFDLRNGFPAVTTKKLFFDAVKGELLGFLRGYTNAADFRALGCKIWDANANETPAWLANRHRDGEDDLGRIYGAQWTRWMACRIVDNGEAANLEKEGWMRVLDTGLGSAMRKSINQVENALRTIIKDPSNRRIIVNAWNPAEFDRMALPPCHVMYQFIADPENRLLHMTMYQRSCDMFLGVPFNIASSALFLSTMAKLSGYTAATFTHFLADAHIYADHMEQVSTQLSREPYLPPDLVVSVDQIQTDDQITGAFTRIEPDHIELVGYQHHPAIKAPMAV